jgi:hypothetical protein
MPVFCSLALKMEATSFTEISIDFHRAARRHIPANISLHNHCCNNLKSYNIEMNTVHTEKNVCPSGNRTRDPNVRRARILDIWKRHTRHEVWNHCLQQCLETGVWCLQPVGGNANGREFEHIAVTARWIPGTRMVFLSSRKIVIICCKKWACVCRIARTWGWMMQTSGFLWSRNCCAAII